MAHAESYFFYDYETWGVHPGKDRPCQFAGVRTDMAFNIIDEPLTLYCQLPVDYLPTPEAALITGITPQKAMALGLPEPEFITRIHQELAKPNTINLGYNNVRFDDEVSRYTLYRNFFDPYGWSYQHGNSRWDLLDVMRACYALRPDGINWPLHDDIVSFKLEHLSVANGIEHSQAHDAMADVHATIALAKQVRQAQPRLFDYLLNHRHKRALLPLIDIVNLTPLVHVSGMLGHHCGNTSWVVPIAWHPHNNNAVIVVNLAMDPQPLFDLSPQDLKERLYTKHEDLADDELAVPLKLIHINKCPVIAPAKTLTADDAQRLGINREQCLSHLTQLKQAPHLREKIADIFEELPHYDQLDVDLALYDGFFSPTDRAAMDIIRETPPENLGHLPLQVTDDRIMKLLFRYRARHFPHTLEHEEQQLWREHCRDYFEQNLPDYMLNLENLVHEHQSDAAKITLLKAIYQYVEQQLL